jgi:acyl carrier protein
MKINTLLIEVFDAKDSQIRDDFKLIDFESWDSMAHMLFITKMEKAYGIELTGEEIAGIKTIGDIKKVLLSKGKFDQ